MSYFFTVLYFSYQHLILLHFCTLFYTFTHRDSELYLHHSFLHKKYYTPYRTFTQA